MKVSCRVSPNAGCGSSIADGHHILFDIPAVKGADRNQRLANDIGSGFFARHFMPRSRVCPTASSRVAVTFLAMELPGDRTRQPHRGADGSEQLERVVDDALTGLREFGLVGAKILETALDHFCFDAYLTQRRMQNMGCHRHEGRHVLVETGQATLIMRGANLGRLAVQTRRSPCWFNRFISISLASVLCRQWISRAALESPLAIAS